MPRILKHKSEDMARLMAEPKERLVDMVLELQAKIAAYRRLDAAQCAQLSHYAKNVRIDAGARAMLDSEREANALLTIYIDQLENKEG